MADKCLFNNPKNDIYYINQNTIKHKHEDFIFSCFFFPVQFKEYKSIMMSLLKKRIGRIIRNKDGT